MDYIDLEHSENEGQKTDLKEIAAKTWIYAK